ncbi:MAG: transporter substrate-binding domain-containing protein [Alphaproteobacteria bacterium]|nr:transporter substrate-binding domain-containing protein [Alphaproteobacteria bacterium]
MLRIRRYLIATAVFSVAAFPVALSTAGPDAFDRNVSLTATERQWLKNHPVIRVAPDPDYPPIESFDKSGNLIGISTNYLKLLDKKLGVKFQVKRLPSWDAAIGAAKSRDIDMLSAATQTAARTKYMSFTSPHIELPGVIIAQEDKKQFSTLKSLHGKRVGVVSNYVWQEWVTRDHPSINLQPVRDLQTGLLLVSFGQLDAMVANLANATHLIKKLGVTNLSVAGETGYYARLAIASRKDWPVLHSILEKAIASISPDEHKSILDKWIGLSASKVVDPAIILWGALVILIAIMVIIGGNLYWNYSLRQRVRQQGETLRESEERYRKIVDLSPDAVFIYANDKFIFSNQAFLDQIRAKSLDDLLGKHVDDLIHQDDLPILNARREALRAGTRRQKIVEVRRLRLDGSVYHTEVAAAPMTWNGKPAIQVVCRDISERKESEAALAESAAQFRAIVEDQTEFIGRSLPGIHTLTFVNQAYCDCFGKTREELIGTPFVDHIPEGQRDEVDKLLATLSAENPVVAAEHQSILANGDVRWHLWTDRAIFDDEGNITEIQAIGRDITQRRLAEAASLTAKEEAELANRAKTEFLANMSHEFRTPLNAILGFSEIINQETLGPVGTSKYREYAGDIHSSGQHLLSLINDVLDISKVEAGHVELREDYLDPTTTIHDCILLIKERATEKNIKIKTELAKRIPLLCADKRRIKQILINLLSNAIKFTEPGGNVTIRAWFDQQFGYQFQIADTGIGIAAEDIPTALGRFQQVDGTLGRQQDGTGLGLPLSKSLVELHGGTLNIDSELGVGTTVSVNLMPDRAAVNNEALSMAAE